MLMGDTVSSFCKEKKRVAYGSHHITLVRLGFGGNDFFLSFARNRRVYDYDSDDELSGPPHQLSVYRFLGRDKKAYFRCADE